MGHLKLFEDFDAVKDKLQDDAVLQFVITESLIEPCNKVLENLKKGSYNDKNLPFLEDFLYKMMSMGATLLGVKINLPKSGNKTPTTMNSYAVEYYTERITVLRTYFQKLHDNLPK
jgi:hypothetical protein